jgi:hypothetical protein
MCFRKQLWLLCAAVAMSARHVARHAARAPPCLSPRTMIEGLWVVWCWLLGPLSNEAKQV